MQGTLGSRLPTGSTRRPRVRPANRDADWLGGDDDVTERAAVQPGTRAVARGRGRDGAANTVWRVGKCRGRCVTTAPADKTIGRKGRAWDHVGQEIAICIIRQLSKRTLRNLSKASFASTTWGACSSIRNSSGDSAEPELDVSANWAGGPCARRRSSVDPGGLRMPGDGLPDCGRVHVPRHGRRR